MPPTRKSRRAIALIGIFVIATGSSFAVEIPQTQASISIDGQLDDEGWKDAKIVRLVQLEPIAGANASERSEVLLVHDGQALYAVGSV